jgi:hypothetical protein
MKKNILLTTVVALVLAGVLCACKGTTKISADSASSSTSSTQQAAETMGGDEEVHSYRDEENQLILSYPKVFSAQGVMDESGTIRFEAQQGHSVLLYWVTPNTYGDNPAEFMKRVTAEKSEELEGNVIIGKSQDLNKETGMVTPCAYYWVVDTDWIVNVAILCGSSQEASQWYDLLKGGAVYIESTAGIDVVAGMSEKEAMDMLSAALEDSITEGTVLVANGETYIDGQHCWTFSFGKNTAEGFTAEKHYAVNDHGEIYILDIINNQYKPLAIG